jgi:predicted nucleic acid-binding protein
LPKQIHTYLEAYFLKKGSFESRQFQIPLSIQIMKSFSLDFPDALIAQNALSEEIPILSYDKDFDRVEGLTRLEPKALIRKFS